jgi:YD repeat-containing protein
MATAKKARPEMKNALLSIALLGSLLPASAGMAADNTEQFVTYGEVSVPVAPGAAGSPETNGNYRAQISFGSVGSGYINTQTQGDEGFGRNVSFLPRVERTTENLPFIRASDGSVTLFTQEGKPWDNLKNDDRSLRLTSDGRGYILTLPSGATTTFSQSVGPSLYPSVLKDPVGNETRVNYVTSGSPIPVTISGGNGSPLVTFKRDGNRVTSIVDRYGLTTRLSYDTEGRLVETKRPDGSTDAAVSYASLPALTLPITIKNSSGSQTLISYTVSKTTNTAFVKAVGAPNGEISAYTYGPTFTETKSKTQPSVRTEYKGGYVVGMLLNGSRVQALQRNTNGTVLAVTDQTGTTQFNYGKGTVTTTYPDGSSSQTVRDDNNNLVKLSLTGSDGQTRLKAYTYTGRLLQNVSVSSGGRVTSSQDYLYQSGVPSRITNRVNTSITLDDKGRPAAAVLGNGSNVSISRATGAITTAVDGATTTVQCNATSDGGFMSRVSGNIGATQFSTTSQTNASGSSSTWQTTLGNSITRGSRNGMITLSGSSSADSCEDSSSQCQTVTTCVANTFGGCDLKESSTCTNVSPSPSPVPSNPPAYTPPPTKSAAPTAPPTSPPHSEKNPTPTPVPGYCSTSGANGCNKGYRPQIVQGPGKATYCTCVRAS